MSGNGEEARSTLSKTLRDRVQRKPHDPNLLATALSIPNAQNPPSASNVHRGRRSEPTEVLSRGSATPTVRVGSQFNPVKTLGVKSATTPSSSSVSHTRIQGHFGGEGFVQHLPAGVHNPNTRPSVPQMGMGRPAPSVSRSGVQPAINILTNALHASHASASSPSQLPPISNLTQTPRSRSAAARDADDVDDDEVQVVGETLHKAEPPNKRPRLENGEADADAHVIKLILDIPLFVGLKSLGQGSLRLTRRGFQFSWRSVTFPRGGKVAQIHIFEQPTQSLIAVKFQNEAIPEDMFIPVSQYSSSAPHPSQSFIRCIIPGPLPVEVTNYVLSTQRYFALTRREFEEHHYMVVKEAMNRVIPQASPRTVPPPGSHSIPPDQFYQSQGGAYNQSTHPQHQAQAAQPYPINRQSRPPLSTQSQRGYQSADSSRLPSAGLPAPPRPLPPPKTRSKPEIMHIDDSDEDQDRMDVDAPSASAKGGRQTRTVAASKRQLKQRPIKEFLEAEMPSTAVARAIKQAHQKASGGPVNLCSDDEDGDEARKPATGRRSRPQRPKTRGSAAEDDPELKSPRAMIQQWMSRHPEAGTKQLFTYPFSGLNAITIAPEDAMRLEHWEYLNDNLLEWYFRVLLLEKCRNRADEVHIFNTFFYTRLKKAVELEPKKSDAKSADASADPPVNQEFERVLRFCKNVDLFTKRLVIVPINENLHWYLAVIANPGKLLVDPPELATAARDEESAASTTSASASAADSNAGADAGWASATGSRTEQHAQRTTADGGMVGMDTTTSALGDQDEFGPDAEAATRPPSSAAPSDKGSVEGDDEPGSTTPRAAQSPVKNGTSKSDQDSPTHSGYASYSAPPSPQLYAADLDARDMEPDVPASDSSMHTKAGRWDDEDDNKETAVAMIQRSNASLRAPRYDQDESMQVDDSIIIGGSPEPEAMTVDVVTVGDEDTEDEKMELSEEDDDAKTDGTTTSAYFPAPPKKYNARANRPVRPTTSLPVPANMPRKPTPLTAPVAAPTPLPESKASIGVSPGSAASTTTAAASGTTSSARSSGSSKDTTYDPDNDVLIVVLDSLNNPRTQPANNLEKYLKRLAVKRGYTVLDNPPIRKPKPKSPRQPNSCDCGVYLLHYVERLLLDTDHMLQHFARVPGVDTKALWVDEEIPKKRVAMTDMVTNYAELYLAQVKSKKMDDASAAEESDHDEIQEVVSKDAPEPEPVSNKRASGGQRLGGRSKAELDAAAAEAGRQVECAEADQHRRDMYSAEFFGDDSHDEQRFARDTATHHDQPRTFPGLPPLPHGHLAPSPSSQTMYAARDRVAKSRPDTPLHHASHVATRELCHVLDSDDDDGDINSAAGQPSVDDGEGDDDLVVPRSRHVPRFKFASGANISARPPPSVPDPFAASKIGYQSGIHGRGFNDVDADIENDDDNKSPEHLHIGDTSPSQKTRAVAADDDVSHDFEMSARYQSRPASQGQSQHYAAGSHTRDQHHFHDLAPRPRAPDAAPNPLPIASSASRHSVIDSGEQDGSGAGNNSNDEEFDAGEFVFHNQPALAASKPTAAIELSDSDEDETRDGSNSRPSPKSTTSSSAPGADDDEDSEYDPCRDPANATHRFTTEPIPSSTATDSALLSKPSTKRPRPVHPSLRNNTAASTSQSASRPASPVLSSPIQVGRASSSVTTAASTVKHAQVDLTGDTDTDDEEQRAGPQPPGAKSSGRSAKAKSGSDTHAPSQVRAPRGRGQVQFPDADVNEAEVQVQPRRSTRSKAGSVIEKRRAEAAAKRH